jgi:glycosyltransferase involved in cell wall biosynthesis
VSQDAAPSTLSGTGDRAEHAASCRVIFVNRFFHPDESATSRMLSDLAFRLARDGINVTVITSRQLYGDARAALQPLQTVNGVTVHRVATATNGRARLLGRALDYASFHASAAMRLLRLARRGDVIVAKTDPPLISVVSSVVAKWRGAQLVNWLQDLFPEVASALTPGVAPKLLERILRSLRDRSLLRASINVVLGARMRDRLLDRGVDPSSIRIVPNWADPQAIVPVPTHDSETRRLLGLTGRFVVGYSGNLGRAHEFETLLGAARLLHGDSEFAFMITGSGAKAAELRATVQSEKLTSFRFQDPQPPERLSDSLGAADVHLVSLLPSLEGLVVPSKIYGILAAGRPAIFVGHPAGELAQLVSQFDCGISVEAGDSGLLARQLCELRSDAARRERMGLNARRAAIEHFTSEHAAASWQAILMEIAPTAIGAALEQRRSLRCDSSSSPGRSTPPTHNTPKARARAL